MSQHTQWGFKHVDWGEQTFYTITGDAVFDTACRMLQPFILVGKGYPMNYSGEGNMPWERTRQAQWYLFPEFD